MIFLRKSREPTCKHFDDGEWLRALDHEECLQDVPDHDVEMLGPEVDAYEDVPMQPAVDVEASPNAVQVRPVQVGEFLRRWVSQRLLLLHRGDINQVMHAMRQLGVGMPGGARDIPSITL